MVKRKKKSRPNNNPQKVILPPKLKNVDHLRALLEILNDNPDRYVPVSELRIKFKEKLDPENKLDGVALTNSLNNTLLFAGGINDKVGRPMIDTPEYLADVAQIWQTKLIEDEQLLIEGKKETCYMIKLKGIEVLNQLWLNENITKFNKASIRASNAIIALTAFLVVLAILQVLDISQTLKNSLLLLVALGLVAVEIRFLYGGFKIKIERKPIGKLWQVVVISGFVILFALMISASKFIFGTPSLTIETTTTGLYGAYGFYILEKYILDAISIENKIVKFIVSSILLVAFLFIALLALASIEIGISLLGLPLVPVGQTILTEDIGGVVGSWVMYVILLLLGLKKYNVNSE